ncbi:MAG: TIGR04086 family membrane protein [Firmicutes bacterium HGW-Firmicutes-8]|nr:MAG: TIGR04086 family membrane protein [Firmicutes bacterium HGW-Firmicutes-8]
MNPRTIIDALTSGGKTALISSGAGCVILLAYSLLVNDKVVYLPYALMAVSLVSVLWGGIRGGMAAATVGWLHGGAVAGGYLFFVLVGKLLVFPAVDYSPAGLLLVLGILLAGGLGGVVGINLKFARKQNRRYLIY